MFGVTTPCVQAVTKRLDDDYDCLVFHATGVGGQSMEKLADSGLLAGVIDVSTTEVADEIVGGVLSAGPTRLDVFARHALPYVGSCGALDMVNFGAWDTVPERFKGAQALPPQPDRDADAHHGRRMPRDRRVHRAQAQRDDGPVRFLIPEGGVSAIDQPGQPFHDPEADRALFDDHRAAAFAPARTASCCACRMHINDEAFADALVAAWHEVATSPAHRRARAALNRRRTAMPRIARQTILDTLPRARSPRGEPDHRRRRRHRPVGQVRRGRRHRPDRHLQLGPLPHGRPRLAGRPAGLRQRQRDRLRDGARGAAGGASTRRCWPASTAPTRS